MNWNVCKVIACAVILLVGIEGATLAASERGQPTLELLFLGDSPVRLDLSLDIDGLDFQAFWDETFSRLFRFHDFDADGRLDDRELESMPSATALRQAMANGFTPPVGASPRMADMDRDGDKSIVEAELAAFFRAAGLGEIYVGVGVLPATHRLTKAIVERLDHDENGVIGKAEWLTARDRLMPLDQNDDDLVGAGELVPGTVYPGAAGTTLLRAGEALPATLDMVPFTVLPVDDPDAMWATAMVKRFPSLSALKLQAARTAPPGASWNMSIPSQGNGSRVLQTAHLRIDGWVTAGKALTSHATAKRSLAASFEKYCDARTRAESTNEHDLHWLVASADRDQSKVVEPNEFSEWMAVQERIVRGQVLLTIFDAGHGLFEIVDEDHDGALSQRELMTASIRLGDAGLAEGDAFNVARMPRAVLMALSHGYPDGYRRESQGCPPWAHAMDRNRDGDVSRREFVGAQDDFDRLDTDRDGLIATRDLLHAEER